MTPSYSIVPPCVTNEFNSSTENTAIERMEYERNREKFMRWIHRAVNRLPKTERKIVIMFYMDEEMGYDPDIREEIGIGKTKYYQLKGKAILRLAFSLKKEVFKHDTESEEVQSA